MDEKRPAYWVQHGWSTPEEEREFAEEYDCLHGPDGFRCVITEPEDRNFNRDLDAMVVRLNEQHARIAELEERCLAGKA